MNSQEAKQILLLYRPGIEADPDTAAALELARNDPELGQWLREQSAFQEALRAKFKQIAIPEGLKEQILSERKARTTLPLRRGVLISAVLVVLLALGAVLLPFFRPHQDRTFASFRNRMVSTVARAYPRMDLETNDLGQIRAYLVQHQAPGDYPLPPGLKQATSTGCAVLQWRGKTVSMVCFNSGKASKAGEPDLFLFVVNRSDVPNAPVASVPQFTQSNRVATAAWSDRDNTYLLAGFGAEDFLKQYF